MGDVPFRNTRNTDGWLPAVVGGARTDVSHSFDSFKGTGPIDEVLERIANEGIPDGDSDGGEEDPCFDALSSAEKKEYGEENEDGGPESTICQKIEKLIEKWVVDSPVDKSEEPEIQRINLGDQVAEAKLVKMVRQVVYALLFLCFLSVGWAQNRKTVSGKGGGETTSSEEEMTPTPQQMQHFLWRTLVMKDLRLKGQVQSGERKIPILVRTKDRLLQFEFQDRALQIRVRFAPEGSLIQKRSKESANWEVVTGLEKTKSVAGTDLAYEDLGIDFLRWPDPQPKGEDSVMMLDCWVYEVTPPVESNYAKVRYWISKTYKTMIRADGLNGKGEAIKRFTFNSVIEAEDTVVIGEMKVAKLTPGTDVSASRTFVQIETVEKGSGL